MREKRSSPLSQPSRRARRRLFGRLLQTTAALLLAALFCVQSAIWLGLSPGGAPGDALPAAESAASEEALLFATLKLASYEEISLPRAYLLIDGRRVASFADGVVMVRVHSGERIAIDSSAYSCPLRFELRGGSLNLDLAEWPATFTAAADRLELGVIRFK